MTSEGISLRDLGHEDIEALARLHVDTFRETHGGGPGVQLRAQQWRASLEHGKLVFCLLLEDNGGQLVGFVSGARHTADPAGFEGRLDKIYVLRRHHRRGLGRWLPCAAASRFLDVGIRSMLLFGDARSPSNAFYEAMGGERLLSDRGEFHGGYGWRDLDQVVKRCCALRAGPGSTHT